MPKSPENYMWIFPTGCYTDCIRKGNYLIGPLLPLQNWSWNNNGSAVSSGSGFASPFTLYSSGNYSMTINTGTCDLESGLLSFSNNRCGDCEIKDVKIEEIKKVEAPYSFLEKGASYFIHTSSILEVGLCSTVAI